MKQTLPAIELPAEPLTPAWEATVSALVERAQTVEAWATEVRERAQQALEGHEHATLALDALLDDPSRHDEAHAAIRVAAEGIRQRRAALSATRH